MRSFITLTLLISFCSHSAPVIGSITKLKGQASLLFLGEREPIEAKLGMKVKKDTSILTKEKSFMQITLFDKSKIILGPKSKMLIDKTPKTQTGLVNLMMGKVRSEVIKQEKKKKNKLIIKTKTAALGVRGTDFQTVYNPQNNITSLITFRGKVAMKKVEKPTEKINDVEKALDKKDTVIVEKGTFSTVGKNLVKATEPVKISPIQYTRLKLNKEMLADKKIEEKTFKKELKKTIKEYKVIKAKEIKVNKLAKREYDVKTKVYRPTAGGIVDLDTGIYVPPEIKEENYDKDLNIYKAKPVIGKVSKAGTYIPPKDVKLDAVAGFVPTTEDAKKKKTVSKLNKEISGQIVEPKKPTLQDFESLPTEDAYDKYFNY